MSRYLVDANVLLRFLETTDAQHEATTKAVVELTTQGHTLHITAQNIIEFWAVATRPLENNGFGWELARCVSAVPLLLSSFAFLPDTAQVFEEWQRLVAAYGVNSLHVHDARLVAVIKANGADGILTFNAKHFRRFEAGENIVVIDPAKVQRVRM